MTDKIIIYGKNGQLGTALAELLQDKAIVFANSEYDFSNIENIRSALKDIDSKAIINATAYTDVNKAETEEEAAHLANALIPEALASYCKERHIPFIHYSTDYVFSGDGDDPQTEDAKTAPLNAYGRTKLAGEHRVAAVGGKYLIFRTSWVYNHSHKNFLTTMLKFGAEREVLSVVSDQYGAPTYAPHLAKATLKILEYSLSLRERARVRAQKDKQKNDYGNSIARPHPNPLPEGEGAFPHGIYHLCNSGATSWHGFAAAIFEEARAAGTALKVTEVNPILASEFPTPAKRPHNSRLDCSRVFEVFGVTMPDWKDGLRECVKKLA